MPVIVMIGCGNIGSRLLQSLVQMDSVALGGLIDIHVVEPSPASRKTALERAQSVAPALGDEGLIRLHFYDTQADAAAKGLGRADFLIVPTNADIRFAQSSEAIGRFNPDMVLFEKFLFQSRAHYGAMEALLKQHGAQAHVHCSRNEAPGYFAIRDMIRHARGRTHLLVSGSGLALASNTVHFTALMHHLTGGSIASIDVAGLVPSQESKREGYAELTGRLRILYDDGGVLDIIEHGGGPEPMLLTIGMAGLSVIVDETAQTMRWRGKANQWTWHEEPMRMIMASGLAAVFTRILLRQGSALPDYAQSAADHLALMGAYSSVFSSAGMDQDLCRVT
jgi:predicted dehydrogenase